MAVYRAGDIVRHAGAFLRSVQWVLDVPVDGVVHGVHMLGGKELVDVEWSDGERGKILATNIEPCPRAAATCVVEWRSATVRRVNGKKCANIPAYLVSDAPDADRGGHPEPEEVTT